MATNTATATEIPTAPEASTASRISTGLELETPRGITTISDDVVAKLAGHACREIEGVDSMGAAFRRLLSRVRLGDEPLAQGVNVEVGKREAAIDVVIVVRYGHSIPTLAREVRENVIARVEAITGLVVKEVNIEVDDLRFEEETSNLARVQ